MNFFRFSDIGIQINYLVFRLNVKNKFKTVIIHNRLFQRFIISCVKSSLIACAHIKKIQIVAMSNIMQIYFSWGYYRASIMKSERNVWDCEMVVSGWIIHVWLYSRLMSSKTLWYECIFITFILVTTSQQCYGCQKAKNVHLGYNNSH